MGFGHNQRGSHRETFDLREGGTVVSDDMTRFVEPGEPEVGWVVRTGRIPLGYFDDADATRKTFPVVEGQRVVVSGDRASLEADGTLRLYGRDSLVVNTGGEKVFVEEVEAVLRACPGVADALVVGRDSDRWGQEIVALVETRPDATVDTESLHARVRREPGAVQGAQGVHLRRQGSPPRQRQGRLPVGEESSDAAGTDMTACERAIDCLVNVHFGETEQQPNWMLKVRDDYFKGPESMFAPVDLSELLDEMDEQGVAKAILMDNLAKPSVTARKFVEARPDRFALAVGGVNLLKPMPSLRELTAVVNDLPVAYAVVGPSFWGDGLYPPSDAVYYPLYTKCAELELPLCINTGLPGPPIPGEVQNPIHLDRVCVRFPELKLCMIHGADPWWDIAIRLMIKYQNLRLMTSAWSPKRLPESLLHYMRTRGKNKVIFASDWPVLRMQPRGARGARAGPARRRAGQLPLQQRSRNSSSENRKTDDGPLRTAQAGLQPVRGPPGDPGGLQAVLQDALPDRKRARRRGIRVRQEPVGAAVRDGCDDDGAARVGGRRRGDAGRPDAGRRGDRPVAGAGPVDRPCRVRRGCWHGWARWTPTSSTASNSPHSTRSTRACRGRG